MADIDPVEYGKLLIKVKHLEDELKLIREDVRSLLALANKSKGGFWAGITIASCLGGFVGWLISHVKG